MLRSHYKDCCITLACLLILTFPCSWIHNHLTNPRGCDPGDAADPCFITLYPPYLAVKEGQSKPQVSQILGIPTRTIGETDPKKADVWLYDVKGWNGFVTIVFDAKGKVSSKAGGNG